MAAKIITPTKGLTDGFVKHLNPQASRYEIADNACPGLRIRIGTTGKKTFVWLYSDTDTKKLKRLTLGRYGAGDNQLSLSAARKALESAKIKLSAGELHTTKASTPKTVSDLCEVFYKDRIIPNRRAPQAVKQIIDHDINPVIGDKNIATISVIAVSNCVQTVVSRGSANHAGKVLAILKQLFKFAEGRGFVDRSPAYSLDKKDLGVITKVRKRWLNTGELKPVWDAINNAPKMSLPVKNGLLVLMLSGVRTGELLKARWEHIDLINKEWFIPEQNTKTIQEWVVPLTSEVISLISELQGIDPVFVFPGKDGSLSEKATGLAMRRLFKSGALTIERATPHDFRRTVRTHLEKLNVAPHIAEKCLNHSLGAINAVYNKNTYLDERREALERWNEFVMLQVNPQANVTHILKAS